MNAAVKESRVSPRAGVTWETVIGGQKIFLRTGEYADGRLCEVFITASKQGTLLQAAIDGWCICLSMGLQHGIPLKQYVDAFEHTKFDPCGPVVGDPEIPWASSLFDYIIRRLEKTYGNGMALQIPMPPDCSNGQVGMSEKRAGVKATGRSTV